MKIFTALKIENQEVNTIFEMLSLDTSNETIVYQISVIKVFPHLSTFYEVI
jgi:hypothetical protein